MRSLGQLDVLQFLEIETEISPMALAEMQAKYKRQRASKTKSKNIKPSDW
jgi:hypothetical protein